MGKPEIKAGVIEVAFHIDNIASFRGVCNSIFQEVRYPE
jgi:hypothetical protein